MLLIHYTDKRNLAAIRESGVLKCALSLMTPGEAKTHAREKRADSVPLSRAVLRDQQPLFPRIVLSDGASFADFVRYLNRHVFFWPNSSAGEKCREAFRRKYQHPDHIGLCCNLRDLRDANKGAEILYSPYNSGSTPRNPKKSPRSLDLFQPLESRGGRRLVEVVVRGQVWLPDNTQQEGEDGKWSPFFPSC